MLIPVTLFWISLSLLFFCYIGYGMLLFFINRLKAVLSAGNKATGPADEEETPVTVVITAYNERKVLEKKIKNTLDLDYPPDKLTIIFVTDGSTDGSEAIIRQYPSLQVLHQPERKGKLAAIKRAMQQVQTPIVVFSDANTELNRICIRKMVSHYHNPKTGGVAGEKKIINNPATSAVGDAEGLYWKYESFMKIQDADFNTVVGAAGELFSIRTSLFPQLDDHIILDDFVISMKICLAGYKIEYEPEAFATEFPSASLAEEEKRKVRISAGVYQCIGYLKNALNIFRHPLLSFQYISRRLLRWIVCPVMLVALLLSNALLFFKEASSFYTLFLGAQLIFYVAACIGWLLILSGKRPGILTIPFYFVFMNYCLVKGFIRFLKRNQSVLWDKSVRQAME
jgi:cellulose synthase/poly-beta-1,6-N-acetylglucosamine synthase-like glycosyltransferase